MPLEAGSSREAIAHNIAELRRAGHPEKQSVAIAMREAGEARADETSTDNNRSTSKINDCSGILFVDSGNFCLLVKRADNGLWENPGGHLEDGETEEDAAVRESEEEIGICPDGNRFQIRKTYFPDKSGAYTLFLQHVKNRFDVKLNHEHTEYLWYPLKELPEFINHNLKKSISLIVGNELDIAESMSHGDLLSPYKYENVWLFDLRITGTGTSYRKAHEEFVYRTPDNFLTEEFVDRCNGLPLIFEHPSDIILNTEEFRQRIIGTIFLPYIRGDEVRGIAKVFDEDGAKLMMASHESTSPAVVFRDAGSTETIEINGKTVLIEGKPSYLDHLAICEEGVWDKGGEPSGINQGDDDMDNEMPVWADALMKRLDSVCARMDSIENKGGDEMNSDTHRHDSQDLKAAEEGKKEMKHEEEAEKSLKKAEEEGKTEEKEEKKADSHKRSDSEEEKEEKKRADSQDKLSRENYELRAEIQRMNSTLSNLTKPLTVEDRDALARAQSRADAVMQMFGSHANVPLHGESPIDYRRRLAAALQKHSPELKAIKLDALEGQMFAMAEDRIYADAQTAALTPAEAPAGRLIPIISKDSSGREITRYVGDPKVWMEPFKRKGVNFSFNQSYLNKGAK